MSMWTEPATHDCTTEGNGKLRFSSAPRLVQNRGVMHSEGGQWVLLPSQ